jgi:hypothetical protein
LSSENEEDFSMRFAKRALRAICSRAAATGEAFMAIDDLLHDLGGPIDFDDVLAELHARGFITLHQGHKALSLTARGWGVEHPSQALAF